MQIGTKCALHGNSFRRVDQNVQFLLGRNIKKSTSTGDFFFAFCDIYTFCNMVHIVDNHSTCSPPKPIQISSKMQILENAKKIQAFKN